MQQFIIQRVLAPCSSDPDMRRREYILNILLSGLFFISCIATLAGLLDYMSGKYTHGSSNLVITGAVIVISIILWRLNRTGYHALSSFSLLGLLSLICLQLTLGSGFELPAENLMFSLLLVIAGVILSSRSALLFNGVIIIVNFLFSLAQIKQLLHPQLGWLNQPLSISDAVGYGVIFCGITLISWLTNREIDRSLKRARLSEAALAVERDNLEMKVIARTQELEAAQTIRLAELERFATFGKLNANLLHEVANPLTAATIHVEQLANEHKSVISEQIRDNLQRLERYVTTARQQLAGQEDRNVFSIRDELKTVIKTLESQLAAGGLSVTISGSRSAHLRGNRIKFSQIFSNLITNATEAQQLSNKRLPVRPIALQIDDNGDYVIINVTNWGQRIPAADLGQIFDPFFSTKGPTGNNLGIGLSMVKQYVTEDFHGSIRVTSHKLAGTTFKVRLKKS